MGFGRLLDRRSFKRADLPNDTLNSIGRQKKWGKGDFAGFCVCGYPPPLPTPINKYRHCPPLIETESHYQLPCWDWVPFSFYNLFTLLRLSLNIPGVYNWFTYQRMRICWCDNPLLRLSLNSNCSLAREFIENGSQIWILLTILISHFSIATAFSIARFRANVSPFARYYLRLSWP